MSSFINKILIFTLLIFLTFTSHSFEEGGYYRNLLLNKGVSTDSVILFSSELSTYKNTFPSNRVYIFCNEDYSNNLFSCDKDNLNPQSKIFKYKDIYFSKVKEGDIFYFIFSKSILDNNTKISNLIEIDKKLSSDDYSKFVSRDFTDTEVIYKNFILWQLDLFLYSFLFLFLILSAYFIKNRLDKKLDIQKLINRNLVFITLFYINFIIIFSLFISTNNFRELYFKIIEIYNFTSFSKYLVEMNFSALVLVLILYSFILICIIKIFDSLFKILSSFFTIFINNTKLNVSHIKYLALFSFILSIFGLINNFSDFLNYVSIVFLTITFFLIIKTKVNIKDMRLFYLFNGITLFFIALYFMGFTLVKLDTETLINTKNGITFLPYLKDADYHTSFKSDLIQSDSIVMFDGFMVFHPKHINVKNVNIDNLEVDYPGFFSFRNYKDLSMFISRKPELKSLIKSSSPTNAFIIDNDVDLNSFTLEITYDCSKNSSHKLYLNSIAVGDLLICNSKENIVTSKYSVLYDNPLELYHLNLSRDSIKDIKIYGQSVVQNYSLTYLNIYEKIYKYLYINKDRDSETIYNYTMNDFKISFSSEFSQIQEIEKLRRSKILKNIFIIWSPENYAIYNTINLKDNNE